jgi:hypothetical protein
MRGACVLKGPHGRGALRRRRHPRRKGGRPAGTLGSGRVGCVVAVGSTEVRLKRGNERTKTSIVFVVGVCPAPIRGLGTRSATALRRTHVELPFFVRGVVVEVIWWGCASVVRGGIWV